VEAVLKGRSYNKAHYRPKGKEKDQKRLGTRTSGMDRLHDRTTDTTNLLIYKLKNVYSEDRLFVVRSINPPIEHSQRQVKT